MSQNSMRARIPGLDIARALAVFGMVLVNFKVVMGASKNGPGWLVWLTGLFEGRAAATFVVLAGVGLSLMSRKARESGEAEAWTTCRRTILKRALLLFAVGLCYAPLWPADILHFYGVYLSLGVLFLHRSNASLWSGYFFCIAVFVLLLLRLDYETGWNWETLHYSGFWTWKGMIRHLFFNGFHPVFPWLSFLFLGLWLGRQDLQQAETRSRLLRLGLGFALAAEILSVVLVRWIPRSPEWSDEIVHALFGADPMPPMPLYMVAGSGAALSVICLSVGFAARFPRHFLVKLLAPTGRMAFTHYIAHVVIGMGVLEAMGRLEHQSLVFALASGVIFMLGAVCFSCWWSSRYQMGPLERLMRQFT